MAEATIDRLQIQIEAETVEGSKGLDKFISSMERLKNMVAGGIPGLSDIAAKFRDLSWAVNGLKGESSTINSIAKSIEKLNNLDVSRASKQLSDVGKSMRDLGGLSMDVKQFVDSMNSVSGMDLQSGKMQAEIMKQQAAIAKAQALIDQSALKSAKAAMGLDAIAEKNRKIEESAKFAAEAQESLDDIVQRAAKRNAYTPTGLESFPSEAGGKKYKMASQIFDTDGLQRASETVDSSVGKTAKKMSLLQRLSAQYYAKLDFIKSILSKIGVYGKENLGEVERSTKKVTLETGRAAKSFRTLLKETKVKSGSGGISGLLKLSNFIKGTFLIGVINEVRKAVQAVENFITEGIRNAINAPEIENLFRVALGGMADEAAEFAEQFRKALGVDVYATKEMLGTFQNLETSMGIGERTAYKMSKSLTILANDMASLYNVKPEQAFENLQSALTGQGTAVRKYGYVITEATIKQTAWKYGVAEVGQELNEQQKVLARYLALIDQSSNAQGDMARTMGSVQNQLRLLSQNITAAGRAIGEAFIPFIEAVTPLLNIFFVVLQRLGTSLARFTYSLFGKDYDAEKKKQQETITGIGGIGNSLDDTADSAKNAGKQMKNLLSGFDELNILQKKMDSATAPEVGAGGLDFDVPELEIPDIESPYDKMADEIMNKLKDIFKVFREAWDIEGVNTVEAMKYAFGSIWEAIKAIGRSFAEVWNNGTGLELLTNILQIVQMIFNIVGDIASAFTIAWESAGAGTGLIQSILDKWNAVFELILSIGDAFRTVWNNGTGVEIWSTILSIATNIQNIIENLADRLRVAWEANDNGVNIWQHILDIGQDVLDLFDRVSGATADWMANINFEPLVSAFENLLGVVERLSASIGEGLAWAYENVLLPFGTWVMETAAPAFLDAVASILGSDVWTSSANALKDLYENALQPIAQWVGGKFVDFLNWIKDNGDLVASLIIGVGAAFATWAIINSLVTGLTALASAFMFLTSPIGIVLVAIAALTAGITLLITHWDDVKEAAGKAWDWIKEKWNAAGDWFKNTVIEPIKKFFSDLWDGVKKTGEDAWNNIKTGISTFLENVKSVWSAGWDNIKNFFSTTWNSIKDTANLLVSSVKQIITGFVDAVKSVWSTGWNGIKNTFSSVWDGMKNVASRAIDTIKNFVGGLIDKVRDAIDWVKDLIGLNKEADRTSQSSRSSKSSRSVDTYSFERSIAPLREQTASFRALSPAPTMAPVAEAFGAAPVALSAEPTVYADGAYSEGGIVNSYQKAQNNSSSQNVNAKDTIIAANAELANAMYQMATMIVEAIESNGVEISADSKGIFKLMRKEASNYRDKTGGPAFR